MGKVNDKTYINIQTPHLNLENIPNIWHSVTPFGCYTQAAIATGIWSLVHMPDHNSLLNDCLYVTLFKLFEHLNLGNIFNAKN